MISVDSLLYKIDQKLNKLSTNEHQRIELEDKILALNEAQILLIKQKYSGMSIPVGIGFDGFRKRYEDLQNIVEDYKDHPLILKKGDENINQWTGDLTKLDPEYLFYVSSYVKADKGKCKNRTIWVNPELAKHADVPTLLNNVNYKPSFEYQETFNTISSNKISIFTDGTFNPSKLYIMYLRYPAYIDKAGYINFEGKESEDKDCELAYFLEDELLNLTVEALSHYTENVSAAQSAQYRIQKSE
ncbi:MAG: hypothetical protein R6T90_08030 [Dissulfuribacterales bacterium]